MKITIELPVNLAIRLRTLIQRGEEGDPQVLALLKQLADLGVDVTKIKLP